MVLETVRPSSGSLALVRTLSWQGRKSTSVMDALNTVENADSCSVAKLWELAVLRGAMPESTREPRHRVRVVDLFCGVGGLSAGLVMAGRLTGINVEPSLAVDLDMAALQVFHNNHATARILHANVDSLLDYSLRFDTDSVTLAYPPEILEHVLSAQRGDVDIVAGGPPCQGYSTFNNHTRQADPRNNLYLTVPIAGIALDAKTIIVENVPAVRQKNKGVVHQAKQILGAHGYEVDEAILDGIQLGVAQARRRHFLVASKCRLATKLSRLDALGLPHMNVQDAISDLETKTPVSEFDVPARLSQQNRERIEWLFANGAHDLPDAQRPKCHQDGHTYPAVYGRMYWDQPAPTLTRGFMSPGRGRYIHPRQPRGLTPHEGARLQGFSDCFAFERADGQDLTNRDYSKLVGDAVPVPMGTAVGLAVLASLPDGYGDGSE